MPSWCGGVMSGCGKLTDNSQRAWCVCMCMLRIPRVRLHINKCSILLWLLSWWVPQVWRTRAAQKSPPAGRRWRQARRCTRSEGRQHGEGLGSLSPRVVCRASAEECGHGSGCRNINVL